MIIETILKPNDFFALLEYLQSEKNQHSFTKSDLYFVRSDGQSSVSNPMWVCKIVKVRTKEHTGQDNPEKYAAPRFWVRLEIPTSYRVYHPHRGPSCPGGEEMHLFPPEHWEALRLLLRHSSDY